MFSLADRKALALGISNDQPIAYGCANAFRKRDAEIAVTYLNDGAKAFVLPSPDVTKVRQFAGLDICLHSIAFSRAMYRLPRGRRKASSLFLFSTTGCS